MLRPVIRKILTVTLCTEIPEKYCVISSYLTNRISASNVQFRAGSSFRGQDGTLHPAAQLILHPLYNSYTLDFDMALASESDNIFANLNF